MEKIKGLALVISGVFLLTFAGLAQAGGGNQESGEGGISEMQKIDSTYKDYVEGEYGGAREVGLLPKLDTDSRIKASDADPTWIWSKEE